MTSEKKDGEAKGWSRAARDTAPYLAMGTGLAVTLLLAIWAGYWIDKRFGTAPVFVLAGSAFGLFAVSYHLYKVYKSMTGGKP